MDELIAFLNARLDEDETAAKYATTPPWTNSAPSPFVGADGHGIIAQAREGGDAEHIARQDPARVLREVAAKRALIGRYSRAASIAVVEGRIVPAFMRGQDDGYAEACLDAIRGASAIWSDHADWRPEWCPECKDGLVAVGGCNCGSPGDASVGHAHEALCGWEQCPNGCWERLHPQQDQPSGA